MDTQDRIRYANAAVCLQQTLVEGNKSSNVDIDFMLENVSQCSILIQELQENEEDDFYKTALSNLSDNLESHINVLNNKLQNLSQKHQAYHSMLTPTRTTRPNPLKSTIHSPDQDVMSPALKKGKGLTVNSFMVEEEQDDAASNQGGKDDKKRQGVIESTILCDCHLKFDDVIGLKESKQSLYEAIIMPLMFPQLFSGGRRPWQRILLFGPPGTGKSRLAKALSAEIKATFYCVSSTDLISSWVGESEKLIKELFHHASSQQSQAIIFIDEIDSLCRHRNSREDEGTRRIKTELLIQMDGAAQCASPKILLLCATNCPWDLDTAFLRRFQKRIYIPLPEYQSRVDIMKLHSKDNPVTISKEEWHKLAAQTEGYSGSDLSTLTMGALLQPVRDLQTATLWQISSDGKWTPCKKDSLKGIRARITEIPAEKVCARAVNVQDFQACLKLHPPTVSKNELKQFEEYTSSYGQNGH